MIGAAIIVFALCTLAFMWLAFTAPYGEETERGFRRTDEQGGDQ